MLDSTVEEELSLWDGKYQAPVMSGLFPISLTAQAVED